MAVLTHLTSNDLYDLDYHAGRAGLRIGNFDAVDLIQTLRHLVQELNDLEDKLETEAEAFKEEIEALESENLELSVERDNLEDTVIELEQKLEKLEKLEKEQADDQ